MKRSEAAAEIQRLFAAFPREVQDATLAVYIEALAKLRSPGALREAVTALIETERWLPTIAAVREEYQRHVDKHMPRALPEPDLTPEQKRENARRARELVETLRAGMEARANEQGEAHETGRGGGAPEADVGDAGGGRAPE